MTEEEPARLATYGTLSPGQRNHHMLTGMAGDWRQGAVRGWLSAAGWGAPVGFPGLVLDPDGPLVQVHVFESLDLPNHWTRLDDFEGDDYRRVVTQVSTPDGTLDAWIYVLAGYR